MATSASTDSVEEHRIIHIQTREAADEAFRIHVKVETTSYVEDDLRDERELEKTIRNYVTATSDHLVKLKMRINMFVTINKLPPELLTHILLFANLPMHEAKHPFIKYTWICCHWRSLLIQNPNFWTMIRFESEDDDIDDDYIAINPFVYEIARRSKSSLLDIMISSSFSQSMPSLNRFFALTSNRIGKLWLPKVDHSGVVEFLLYKTFPSLRGINYLEKDLISLLPIFAASHYLETFQGDLLDIRRHPPDASDQLTSIFGRLRNLNLAINDRATMEFALDLLHNSHRLQNLKLRFTQYIDTSDSNNPTHQTILPELQFLSTNNLTVLEHFRTPQLSGLDTYYGFPGTYPIIEHFDFSSINSLYLVKKRDSYFITGLKYCIRTKFRHRTKSKHSTYYHDSVEIKFSIHDFLSETCPRDCFRFECPDQESLAEALATILPRMTCLRYLYYLLDNASLKCREIQFDGILSQLPSLKKVVVEYDDRLMDFIRLLNEPSICPQLEKLYYVTGRSQRISGEEIARLLTECIRSRQRVCSGKLEYISLEKCPSLPVRWLNELDALGTTVVNVESVKVRESNRKEDGMYNFYW